MKKIFTLLLATCVGCISFAQTVFQSDLSSWSGGVPTDWMGYSTSISSSDVHELTASVAYGTSYASLVNTTSYHKRFSTQAITVSPDSSYLIEMWLSGYSGEIRTGYYDVNDSSYGNYNSYLDLSVVSGSTTTRTLVSQIVTVNSSCTSAEFILSVRNTDSAGSASPFFVGILIDSVSISVSPTPPPVAKTIYDIQYTSNANGDSPELGNIVTTNGVITGIVQNGPAKYSFFIQDSASAWNGLYIYALNDSSLLIGDSVEVTGTVDEFNLGTASQNVTELSSVSNITVISSGNSLPSPVNVTTGNANMEQWEGVLIKVNNAQCTSNSVGYGMWSLDDGSGVIQADDEIYEYANSAIVSNSYNVVGISHYTFDEYKILPRDINDIDNATSILNQESLNVKIYPNPANEQLTIKTLEAATVIIYNIMGEICEKTFITKGTSTIDISNLSSGSYFIRINNSVEKLIVN